MVQVGATLKEKNIANMQRDAIVKFWSNAQCLKIPEWIPISLENRFFPNSKHEIFWIQYFAFGNLFFSEKDS